MNLICFADENTFILLALSNMVAEVERLASQKLNRLANFLWLCAGALSCTNM